MSRNWLSLESFQSRLYGADDSEQENKLKQRKVKFLSSLPSPWHIPLVPHSFFYTKSIYCTTLSLSVWSWTNYCNENIIPTPQYHSECHSENYMRIYIMLLEWHLEQSSDFFSTTSTACVSVIISHSHPFLSSFMLGAGDGSGKNIEMNQTSHCTCTDLGVLVCPITSGT